MNKPIVTKKLAIEDTGNYYHYTFTCNNCGKYNPRHILKGNKIESQSVECENCGCLVKGVRKL